MTPLFPGVYALGEYVYNLGTHDPFYNLPDDPETQLIYLAELYPFSETKVQSVQTTMLYPGVLALGEFVFKYSGGEVTERLSDVGYITEPTDSKPNKNYLGRIVNALQIETSVFGNNGFDTSQSFGGMEIVNADGEFDRFYDYHWTDRRVVVKTGTRDFAFDSFATIFEGTINNIEGDDTRVLFTLNDNRSKLEKPIQRATYGGTGGIDGMTAIAGQYKPLLFGTVFNFEPVLVDYANQVYQLHDGAINSVTVVRDRGVRLQYGGDVADITLAVPSAGYYMTQLSGGYIKLGSQPSGQITIDAIGQTATAGASDGVSLAILILQTHLGIFSLQTSDYDTASFATVKAASPYTQGMFINDDMLGTDVLDYFVSAIGDFWTFTRQGKLFFGTVTTSNPVADVKRISIDGITLKQTVPPSWKITVNYAPVVVLQGTNDLAEVTDADRAFVTNEYRSVIYTNETTRRTNKGATERIFNTAISNQSDAQALLTKLSAIHGVKREVYEAKVFNTLYKYYIADVVTLKYNRRGFDSGKNFLIVGNSDNAATNQTTLTLWG